MLLKILLNSSSHAHFIFLSRFFSRNRSRTERSGEVFHFLAARTKKECFLKYPDNCEALNRTPGGHLSSWPLLPFNKTRSFSEQPYIRVYALSIFPLGDSEYINPSWIDRTSGKRVMQQCWWLSRARPAKNPPSEFNSFFPASTMAVVQLYFIRHGRHATRKKIQQQSKHFFKRRRVPFLEAREDNWEYAFFGQLKLLNETAQVKYLLPQSALLPLSELLRRRLENDAIHFNFWLSQKERRLFFISIYLRLLGRGSTNSAIKIICVVCLFFTLL